MLRSIKSEARQVRTILGRVAANGVIAEGVGQFTVSRPSAGDYTITFATRFTRIPVVCVTTGTASTIARLGTVSTSSVQILTTNLSAVATDAIIHIQIMGFDTAS